MFNIDNVDDYEHLQQSEKGKGGKEKMEKKELYGHFKSKIVATHKKAKQMKEELSGFGLDGMTDEQERMMIASIMGNEFWDTVM